MKFERAHNGNGVAVILESQEDVDATLDGWNDLMMRRHKSDFSYPVGFVIEDRMGTEEVQQWIECLRKKYGIDSPSNE